MLIATKRLDLIAATPDALRAAIDEIPRLGRLLEAEVSRDWPPELLDADALSWTLAKLEDPANEPNTVSRTEELSAERL